jgi:N-methylhydantoinase B
VHGGGEAQSGRVLVYKAGRDEPDLLRKTEDYALDAGDIVIVETGGGGGYGDPAERETDAIERDLRRGYVTAGAARREYGVTIDADGRVTR